MTRILIALLSGLALAQAAVAAPFNAAQVPAAAVLVLHLDADALRQTAPGRALLEHLNSGKGGQQMDALAAVLGWDLRRDLAGLTLFNTTSDEREGVALLRGRFDPARLEVLLKADAGYRSEVYQGATVHGWIDQEKKQRRYGALLGDLAVVSGSKAAVQRTLDVLQARAPALAGANPNQLPLPEAGAAFALAAANLAAFPLTNTPPHARSLRMARSGSFTLAEAGGQVLGQLTLRAEREEAARLMADAGRGLLALAQLDDQQDEAAREMLRALRIEQGGSEVALHLTLPAEKAAVWLRMQLQKDAQKKAAEAAAVE